MVFVVVVVVVVLYIFIVKLTYQQNNEQSILPIEVMTSVLCELSLTLLQAVKSHQSF